MNARFFSFGFIMPEKLAFWSIPVSLFVLLLKVFAWQLTGSVAMLSDALETVVNVVAATLAFFAVRIANKPADRRHPFGHRKAEYISAVAEGVMIIFAAFLILREAGAALSNPHLDDVPIFGLVVNAIATLINGAWATVLLRAGRRNTSPALIASARHIFTDVFTSLGVLVGLGLALVTAWLILDPLLAIVVALNILWEGWKVTRESVDGLMDVSLTDAELTAIDGLIRANMQGALQYHDLKGRRSGKAIFAEFHLVVDGTMQVDAAHDISDQIETAMVAVFPASTFLIHLEPDSELHMT